MALARSPDRPLLLLDERLSSPDARLRLLNGDMAIRLLPGRTVLIVIYDPAEVARLDERMFVMTSSVLATRPTPLGPVLRRHDAPDVLAGEARLDRQARCVIRAVFGVLAVVVLWQTAEWLPGPRRVLLALIAWRGEVMRATAYATDETLIGFALGATRAIALAVSPRS